MESKVKKVYMIVSAVVLGFCIYGLLLPAVSPLLERIVPGIWTCPFLRMTGQPCPFCGITHGLTDLYRLNISGASIVTMIIFLLVLVESAYRIMILLTIKGIREKIVKILAAIDIAWHLILAVIIAVYAIIYLVIMF
ncbi:MAG: DUF2752 domain-containing protein [Clostridia bacterium]|nr:DUF2752 domain-containing protein [Clostridia bacterium]